MAKKKTTAKFPSHSTPGHKMDISSWLVEIALTRENCGVKLPPRFWSEVKWKFRFRREIMAVKKFINTYGEKALLDVVLKNYITTYTDYAQMEVLLQQGRERLERLAKPKDTSEVKPEVMANGPDLRDERIGYQKKKSLFERLKEISNGG